MTGQERKAAAIGALAIAGLLGTAGLLDVAWNGRGLDAAASAGTVGLWVALGAPLALAAGLLAAPTLGRTALAEGSARAGLVLLILSPLAAAVLGFARSDTAVLVTGSSNPAPGATPAHVVLIVLDTLRVDRLGAYGAKSPTPAFDALARQGVLFDRCFAQASWTVPSHASLFTGLYPSSHGASFEHARRLDDGFTTIAESLGSRGYRTAAFVANPHVALANLDQGFERYREIAAPFARLAVRKPLALLGGPARWIDEGTAEGVDAIERFLAEPVPHRSEPAAPLFLFVNLLEPHWRHLPPYAERSEALSELGGIVAGTWTSTRFWGPFAMARGGLETPRELATLRALYDAEVRYQDHLLGRLIAALDARLDPERTVLIVTSDHGENLGEGGRFDHVFALNDHLIHVPLLIRYPPRFLPGSRRSDLCELVDVPATLADLLGHPSPAGPGLPLGRHAAHRRFVHAEGDPYLDHLDRMAEAGGSDFDRARYAAPLRSVRGPRYKLVTSSETSALFDLETDPDELEDVSSRLPAQRRELEAELERWQASLPRYRADPSDSTGSAAPMIDEEARDRLDALGYGQ